LFIDHAPAALAMLDREMRYLAVSRRWLTDYRLEDQGLTGRSHYDIFPDLPERWQAVHRRGLEGEIMRANEDSFERADGLVQWLRWEVRPWRTTAGDVGGIIIFTEDITARKRAEEALYQSEKRFAKTFRANPLAMSLCRQSDGHFITINDSFIRLFGYHREEVIGHTSFELNMYRHPDDRVELMRQLQEQGALYNYELTMLTKSGEPRQTLLSIELIDLNGETYLLSIMVDITERKEAEATQAKLEEQLRQAQKMESIGRLAGGVAHDFNNLLTVIQGYAELMQMRLASDDPLRRSAAQIQQAAESAASLTRQLLAFSRKQILAPTRLDLNELVSNLHKMLKRLIGEDILLETNLTPNLHAVLADPGQMEQVLLNLVVNARDAMPTGGRLTLETANVELDQVYLSTHLEAPLGPAVMLAVTDTGQGMDKQTQAQIFEPFFTTKTVGQGTGLGLSTVYGIVKQSGGDIHVYSEPGQGTTFKIYLPAVETAAGPLSPEQAQPEVRGGSETILLVEDEEMVRSLILTVLEEEGYTLLEARRGEEALILARTHPGAIDLLITDVVMPEMSGRVLAGQLTALRPGLKVLYISGYTDDAVVRHGLLTAEVEFLSKPFSPTVLAGKVRAMLDL
jgi:PAS domain S-box-containing protein